MYMEAFKEFQICVPYSSKKLFFPYEVLTLGTNRRLLFLPICKVTVVTHLKVSVEYSGES